MWMVFYLRSVIQPVCLSVGTIDANDVLFSLRCFPACVDFSDPAHTISTPSSFYMPYSFSARNFFPLFSHCRFSLFSPISDIFFTRFFSSPRVPYKYDMHFFPSQQSTTSTRKPIWNLICPTRYNVLTIWRINSFTINRLQEYLSDYPEIDTLFLHRYIILWLLYKKTFRTHVRPLIGKFWDQLRRDCEADDEDSWCLLFRATYWCIDESWITAIMWFFDALHVSFSLISVATY